MRGPVVPDCPELTARVDVLVDGPGALVVANFQTSRRPWGPAKRAEAAPLLLLTGELARVYSGGKPVHLAVAILTTSQRPRLVVHRLPLDPERVTQAKIMAGQVCRAIQAGNIYPSPSAIQCPSCPYRAKPCQAWPG